MNRSLVVVLGVCGLAAAASAQSHHLTGWAAIPSTYVHPGPVSGQFITGANGVTPPFSGQPIPGFSGYIPAPAGSPGSAIGLPDNGYGAQNNSADYVLGFYYVTPSFKTTGNGTTAPGSVAVNQFVPFNDANGILTNGVGIEQNAVYTRTNYYPAPAPQIAVDPAITSGKLLTGADFDVESIARMNDGTFWVGEEFGPFLLHFGANGTLLSEPVPHPVLRAPQNPQGQPANLGSSRGFESMTRNADGTRLYLTTEAAINGQADRQLLTMYEFDTTAGQYTAQEFKYRKVGGDEIFTGDMTLVADNKYIVLERDNGQGPTAQVKKLFLIDLTKTDENGELIKIELADLLNIADPSDIGGPLAGVADGVFNLPIQSVESVTLLDEFTIAVAVDTNYPFGNGRNPGSPDDTEIITIRFDVPIASIAVPAPGALALLGLGGLVAGRRRRN
jgi:MYXO-CTERM domain-containing protein